MTAYFRIAKWQNWKRHSRSSHPASSGGRWGCWAIERNDLFSFFHKLVEYWGQEFKSLASQFRAPCYELLSTPLPTKWNGQTKWISPLGQKASTLEFWSKSWVELACYCPECTSSHYKRSLNRKECRPADGFPTWEVWTTKLHYCVWNSQEQVGSWDCKTITYWEKKQKDFNKPVFSRF